MDLTYNPYIYRKGNRLGSTWMAIYILLSLNLFVPIIGRFISTFLTTYFLLALEIMVWWHFLTGRSMERVGKIWPMVLITAITSLNLLTHGGDLIYIGFDFLTVIGTVMIAMECGVISDRQKRVFFKWLVIAILITTITTILGLATIPGASRYAAMVMDSNDPVFVLMGWLNIGGFTFTYILVSIYPVLICFLKKTHQPMWIKIGTVILLLMYFLSAEYMTALMSFSVLSLLWFMPKNYSGKQMAVAMILVYLIYLLLQGPLASLLYNASKSTDSTILSERFQYIADSATGVHNTSDVGQRETALTTSLYGFLSSPIFGNWWRGGAVVGGHSFILDFLSFYGIVGAWLLYVCYRRIYIWFYKPITDPSISAYALAGFITAIFLSTVNTGNHWFELMLVNPIIISVIPYFNRRGQSEPIYLTDEEEEDLETEEEE